MISTYRCFLMIKPFVFSFLLWLSHFEASQSFTNFIFGDSLVDVGNNNYIFTLSKADSSPYGIDFGPSNGQPTGRFTNGRTISDIIGEALGAKSAPPPYLEPNSEANTIYNGINYASGAAGILDDTGLFFIGRVPLRDQVSYFEKSRDYMVKSIGENDTKEMLKKSIFTITIGSNDILNYIQPSIPFFSKDKLPSDVLQDSMVFHLTTHLKRLHELGARKFVVVGVGPLGCIPFARALNLIPAGQCSDQVNQIVRGYNMKLRHSLTTLTNELSSKDHNTTFVYANSYDLFLKLVLNYRQFGLENADKPCCGGYFPPFACFKGPNQNSSQAACEDRSKFVFWDAYHPTEAANLIVAKALLDGDQTVATPFNIRYLNDL
ncbi:GDSL esterase/lipase [Cardamine amara subsp. amara]|uniref:GDSL esterase/lipase n=1 Tax=Cardamine amara subsp. amara TaxID=228776 RepID=A0ABD1BZU4_CARAN